MSASWGDERDSFYFRKNEIWVSAEDVELMTAETEKLVERLESIRPLIMPPELMAPALPA